MNNELIHTRLNSIFACTIAIIVFIGYAGLAATTVCFWDCGEYVAAGYSLGVPHPPGNPLYMLIGRTFTILLFFVKDIAMRMNLISVIFGSLTAMFIYLSIVRIFTGWLGTPDCLWKRITVYTAAVVGSLFAAFSNTLLFSAVESEVNHPILLPIILSTWIALVWAQSRDAKRDRYLLLIAYLSFLGIGIHMYSMITLIPIFIFVVANDREKLKDWRLWITVCISGLVIYDIFSFIYLGTIIAAVTLFMSFQKGRNQGRWRFCFWVVFFALLGYSVHLYIPIRSSLCPMIDENHPATWEAFKAFLERKQYGSENMVTRMFWRLGSWKNQFGIEGHMGFGGFFLTQFFRFSLLDTQQSLFTKGIGIGFMKLLIYLIPAALMVFGWYALWKKQRKTAAMLILLVVLTTVGLVFYMNFADGTRPMRGDYIAWIRAGKPGAMPLFHREVRVRDYFYITGFMYYGMWIGIASGCMLYLLFTNRRKYLQQTVAPIAAILLIISPVLPFWQNAALNNRRNDRLPFDYAYNLLMSCERDGILFTNGDNDTFPLWALQEAYGIRRDIRIINLSLLNTDWYIRQLRDLDPKVRVSFSDREIDNLRPERNPLREKVSYKLHKAGISVVLPGQQEKHAFLVQDKMILDIVNSNNWKKPVYFAATASPETYIGLEPYLQVQGMVFRVMPEPISNEKKIDLERTLFLLDKVYRFRGLREMEKKQDETVQNVLHGYSACFIQLGYAFGQHLMHMKNELIDIQKEIVDSSDTVYVALYEQKKRDYEYLRGLIVNKLDECITMTPGQWRCRLLLNDILVNHGRLEEAEKRAVEAVMIDPDNPNYLKMMTMAYGLTGKSAEAHALLLELADHTADNRNVFIVLANNYISRKDYDSAVIILKQYLSAHPKDVSVKDMIVKVEKYNKAGSSTGMNSNNK